MSRTGCRSESYSTQHGRKRSPLRRIEVPEIRDMAARNDHHFERPNRPERNQHDELVVTRTPLVRTRASRARRNRRAGNCPCVRDRPAAPPVPSTADPAATTTPRSDNADVDCWHPSSRRDFRRSGRCPISGSARSSANCSVHVSITGTICSSVIRASVKSCRGLKHTTRHTPRLRFGQQKPALLEPSAEAHRAAGPQNHFEDKCCL